MRDLFFSAIVLSVACLGTSQSQAADLSSDDLGVSVTLRGQILPGDAEKLAAHFLAIKPLQISASNIYYAFPNSLYLSSSGGDVAEAFRIAALVRALGLSVAVVPNGAGVCASSCFLIYVAANERSASGIDEIKAKGAKGNLGPLGIHRPYLREIANGPSGAQKQEEVMAAMRAHLASSGVGHALIDKMMSHASNDVYWLTAEEIRALGAYSPGVEEQLIAKCGYNSKQLSKMSAGEYIESTTTGTMRCVTGYMTGTYEPLKRAAIDRIRKGWRPWK